MSNPYAEFYEPQNRATPVNVKVEHPEFMPHETGNPIQLTNMRLYNYGATPHSVPEPSYKQEIYQRMEQIIGDDSVIDFIENSIDKFFVGLKDKSSQGEKKLRLGAERQRIYRKNESQIQRERRLELARQYVKRRRDSESEEQRFERLKKQRERIRALRESMKMNPEIYSIRKQSEAQRMKMRRANETPLQRMIRLEKSRVYSRKRRADQMYRTLENEKNRIAHQGKRADLSFRLQERERDRLRKRIKRELISNPSPPIIPCKVEIQESSLQKYCPQIGIDFPIDSSNDYATMSSSNLSNHSNNSNSGSHMVQL